MDKPTNWTDEHQTYLDAIVKTRLDREKSKAQGEFEKVKAELETVKAELDKANQTLTEKEKDLEILQTSAAELEKIKSDLAEKESLEAKKDAYKKAGGKLEHFEKVLRLVDENEQDFAKAFKNILSDEAFAGFRDVVKNDTIKPDNIHPDENKPSLSKLIADKIFKS